MARVVYHLGGYLPGAPQKNRAEYWDEVAGIVTTWDVAGAQTSQRALTPAEVAELGGGVIPATVADLATKAQTALANNVQALTDIAAARANLVASRDAVNNGIRQAFVTLSTANITTVAQAQTALRSVGTQMVALIAELMKQTNIDVGVLDNLKVRINQDQALIRLVLGLVLESRDVLRDNAGTNGPA